MTGINPTYIQGYASSITGIINTILVPTLISIAFIVFLYGIYRYFIKGATDEKERVAGRIFALYGIIGFVILFSVWGIVQIFMGTLGLTASNVPSFPLIPTGSYKPASGGGGSGGNGSLFPGGGLTSAQTQADASINKELVNFKDTCAQYGSTSVACKTASMTFEQAFAAYKDAYGGAGSTPQGGSCTGITSCSGALTCEKGTCVELTNPVSSCAIGSTLDDYGGCVPYSFTAGVDTTIDPYGTAPDTSGGYYEEVPYTDTSDSSSFTDSSGNVWNYTDTGTNPDTTTNPDASTDTSSGWSDWTLW